MNKLKTTKINTPIGEMIAMATDDNLVLLEFFDNENQEKDIEQVEEIYGKAVEGENLPLKQIRVELEDYFKHPFATFKTPIELIGTDFQKQVWKLLEQIPYGKTISYLELSKQLGDVKAIRAVANANGKNPLWILIPCHRVIGSDGSLTGYAGGLHRKKWLLEHESPHTQTTLF